MTLLLRFWSAPVFAFLGLAGYAATLLTFLVHEGLGHGATALVLGGRLHDLYVSPLSGSANTIEPAFAELLVVAGGTVVTVLVGIGVWVWVRNRLRRPETGAGLLTTFLWLFACEAILDSLGYMTLQPIAGSLAGVESGDWLQLSNRLSLSPWVLMVAGIAACVPLGGILIDDASRIAARLGIGWQRHRLIAFWLLLAPGVVLLLGYLVVLHRWIDGPLVMAFGSILGVPLVGVLV